MNTARQALPAGGQRVEKGAVRLLALALNGLSALALFALMAITCVDVAGRYLFNNPLTGSTELTELAVGAVIFSAFPLISWRNEQVVVDILDRFVPPAVHKIRAVVFHLCAAAGLAFVGQRIIVLAERSLGYGEVTEFLAIPAGWMIYFFGVMCWLTAGMLLTAGIHGSLTAARRTDSE